MILKKSKNDFPIRFIKKYRLKKEQIQPLDDIMKGLMSKFHIVQINTKLQLCAYPNLHKNVHYTINSTKCMNTIIRKYHKDNIEVKYYSAKRNYVYKKEGDIIVINESFKIDDILTNENMIEAKNTIDVSKFDRKTVKGSVKGGQTGKHFQG